jgi:hypothetical protein
MQRGKFISSFEQALGWTNSAPLGDQPTHGHFKDNSFLPQLFSTSRLFELITRRSLEPPQLRLFRDGNELHPNEYLSNRTSRRQQVVPMADLRKISPLLDDGATIVLDALDTIDSGIEVVCRALQWWTLELVQANAYFTTGETRGFPLHWDDHDVLVLQLEGEKYWEVRGKTRSNPMFRDASPNHQPSDEVIWSGIVKAGDVLHIPRGYWHQAHREGLGTGKSLHLTFGIVKRTGVDWLAWLADQSRADDIFRRDLVVNETENTRSEHMQLLRESALRLFERLGPEDYLITRRRTRQAMPSIRHKYTNTTKFDPIVCICEFPPDIEKRNDTFEIYGAGTVITILPAALAPAQLLLSGFPITLEEIESRTGIDASSFANVLLENGLCAVMTPELLSVYTDLITTSQSLEKQNNLVLSG